LKILSRITEPTSGKVSIKGRVASLLEVGTGFHPELTGRENIFLNGAILGMNKAEIKSKFDEIVAFAEVEKFLDTPVKHYSSGMYVRLAFAVAAHLEPEILILDEVLAVGDAQFQKKCVGKMSEVAKDGKTVIFVSHSMGIVSELCSKAILLGNGGLLATGTSQEVVDRYLKEAISIAVQEFVAIGKSNQEIFIEAIRAINKNDVTAINFAHNEPIRIALRCVVNSWVEGSAMWFFVIDHRGRKVFTSKNEKWDAAIGNSNYIDFEVTVPKEFLVPGQYNISLAISVPHIRTIDFAQDALMINVMDAGSIFASFDGLDYGCVFADCKWDVIDQR
jgi:lipopolysaccharide transport system ATP-binding protein